MTLEDAFRQLRHAWFMQGLHCYAHERDWELESDELRREQRNAEMRAIYDADTERIIAGGAGTIAPTCWADMQPEANQWPNPN